MMGYRELMQRKLLEDIYDRMSDEEKRTFVQLTIQNRDHEEIMRSLSNNEKKIDSISEKIGQHPFASDIFANIAGNAITDSIIAIGKILFKKL